MSQIPVRAHCGVWITAALALWATAGVSHIAHSQEVAALVDGQPITTTDIDHRTKFIEMSTHKTPTRQEVIDGLTKEILDIHEAKRHAIDPSNSDVDDAFNGIATTMNLDAQKLAQILTNGGASTDTLKQRLRAQMARSRLARGNYKLQ